ncbi:hypothetical protein B0T09DRAFT_27426 [Sordaria sp. MPI-SDFR-AT-0083]|nr:hypothetical protein B0T09DRAFT_27426 [Sordaria sp. MPI-SDFR-AT-0083]
MADVWAALDFAGYDWPIVRISRSTAQLSASVCRLLRNRHWVWCMCASFPCPYSSTSCTSTSTCYFSLLSFVLNHSIIQGGPENQNCPRTESLFCSAARCVVWLQTLDKESHMSPSWSLGTFPRHFAFAHTLQPTTRNLPFTVSLVVSPIPFSFHHNCLRFQSPSPISALRLSAFVPSPPNSPPVPMGPSHLPLPLPDTLTPKC